MNASDAERWLDDLSRRVLPGLLDSLGASSGVRVRPGDRIGSYRLDAVLGHGGMGTVFRAQDETLGRAVAIKFLHASAAESRRLHERTLAEARAAARLDHPGIAVVHEVGETDDGHPFIVMALYEGQTLAERLERGPLRPEEATEIVRQIADALDTAHRAGVVHRDIKPTNIILTASGRVKIVDFGIAAEPDADGVNATIVGTAPYMSPEQLEGTGVDARTDLWSLGAVLYEMLAGARPFPGDSRAEVLSAVAAARPEPLRRLRPDMSEGLASVVDRCLARDPADRFASAEALLTALMELAPEWPGRGSVPAPAPSADVAALYLRGRRALEGGDRSSAERARECFAAALDEDPSHAPSWAGLSDAFESLAYTAGLPPEEAHLRARAAAERALALDPRLAEAHVSLATVLVDYYREWERAERHYLLALELDPEYATGHQLYAEFLRDRGRADEALREIDVAIRLDPLSPFYRLVRGIVLHMGRRHEEALEAFESLLRVTPGYPPAHFFIALTCASADKPDRALRELDRMDPEGQNPDAICVRAVVRARQGETRAAERALASLEEVGEGYHVLPYHRAYGRLALGDRDRALDLLEQDAELRTWSARLISVEPLLDPLRDHPRFKALEARIHGRRGE